MTLHYRGHTMVWTVADGEDEEVELRKSIINKKEDAKLDIRWLQQQDCHTELLKAAGFEEC